MNPSRLASLATLLVIALLLSGSAVGKETAPGEKTDYERIVSGAIQFVTNSQAEDGAFSSQYGSGVTSLVTTGLLRHGRSPQDPMVARALAAIEKQVKPDGGVYLEGSRHRNYETCLAIMCFSEARKQLPSSEQNRYDNLLANAERFVKDLQWDVGEGHGTESMNYGGAGYGSHSRPDLSNTGFLIEALKSLGRGEDDPNMQAALVFVSRSQNLETSHNSTPFAAKVNDGGFYYTPAAGGQSQAGETESGGLRSYGSMTYVGLKSMLYAGVGPDDPRVKAAYNWAMKNYTVETNPGMGSAGYYYYLHTFAKALHTIGKPEVIDQAGVEHDWRAELINQLATTQAEDGSWVNPNERWLESDPNLVVGYCLLALSYCTP